MFLGGVLCTMEMDSTNKESKVAPLKNLLKQKKSFASSTVTTFS